LMKISHFNITFFFKVLGFWTLSIVRNSKYKKHNFYCIFSCFISWTHPGVRRMYSCCYVTWVVQWLRLALSNGPNRVCVSPCHLRTETDPVSETLCFLVFRIPDDRQVQKPSSS
jgi:hypothetical protein